jgi:H+/Cl- antiporter ClcA
MSPWDQFLHQVELLATALTGIILATIGDLVRLFHEQERGGPKVTLAHFPGSLLRGTLMGVIAVSVSQYLHGAYNVPELAGGGIGGALGYLGPSMINVGFQWLASRFSKKADGNDGNP